MKKQITLKEVITSLCNSEMKYEVGPTHEIDLKTATPNQKYDFWDKGKRLDNYVAISVKNGNLYCYHMLRHLKRCGTKYYIKKDVSNYFSIIDGKVKLGKDTLRGCLLHRFHIAEWLPGDYHITNATILKAILTSEVYSEESLYKFIAKKIIREDIPWRLLKEYKKKNIPVSIYDLKCITNNVQEAMRTLLNVNSNYEDFRLIRDVLQSAIRLGEQVNPKWSLKRFQEEHKRQIKEIAWAEIEEKEDRDLYSPYTIPSHPNIAVLKTEREVFLEASEMHHCLHSNYWNRIKGYRYMAFSVIYNAEKATMGVGISDCAEVYIDQIHGPYNRRVSPKLAELCEEYIKDKKDIIIDIIKHKHKRKFRTLEAPNPYEFGWNELEGEYNDNVLPY